MILEFELRALPRRVRGATLEGAALRELREHSGWDSSEQACLRILDWLRRKDSRV